MLKARVIIKKIIFLCEKELVLRIIVWYEEWDIQMFFLFYQIVKEKEKTRSKVGKPPELQQANKHKENLVNETIYAKNPC